MVDLYQNLKGQVRQEDGVGVFHDFNVSTGWGGTGRVNE